MPDSAYALCSTHASCVFAMHCITYQPIDQMVPPIIFCLFQKNSTEFSALYRKHLLYNAFIFGPKTNYYVIRILLRNINFLLRNYNYVSSRLIKRCLLHKKFVFKKLPFALRRQLYKLDRKWKNLHILTSTEIALNKLHDPRLRSKKVKKKCGSFGLSVHSSIFSTYEPPTQKTHFRYLIPVSVT